MRFLLLLCLLVGCSGYRFTQQDNPLAQYGIRSLSVPMFYNYSNLPEVSADFTRETYKLLSGFSGLKLKSGYHTSADAVLIGIIKTREKTAMQTQRPGSLRSAQAATPGTLGTSRQQFYVPGSVSLEARLQIIVIKKPSQEDLSLLQSGIGESIKSNSKIVFNEIIPLNSTYTREFLDDAGTQVIATQNAGVQRRTIKTMAENAAISVRDMILYAF